MSMNRRELLQRGLKGAVALAAGSAIPGLGGPARAASPAQTKPANDRSFTFVLLSDPHLANTPVMNNIPGVCQFREAMRDAAAKGADLGLVLGDLTSNLPTSAMEARIFKGMIQLSPLKLYYVPGNHDVGNHKIGKEPAECTPDKLALYRRTLGKDYYSFTHKNCQFIALNSALFNLGGDEEATHWAFLEKELQDANAAGRKHIFIFMHHVVSYQGNPSWGKGHGGGAEYYELQPPAFARFTDLLGKHKVTAVLSGHTHKPHVYDHEIAGHTVQFVHCPPLSFYRNVCGYDVVRVTDSGIAVTEHNLLKEFGRKTIRGVPEADRNNWSAMAGSWLFKPIAQPPAEAELLKLSSAALADKDAWQKATLPLLSGHAGWQDGNIKADSPILVANEFSYSPRDNMLVVAKLFSNNALAIYLNGRKLMNLDEIAVTTAGLDHHRAMTLALDPDDLARGTNRLLVLVEKPKTIKSMAFSMSLNPQAAESAS